MKNIFQKSGNSGAQWLMPIPAPDSRLDANRKNLNLLRMLRWVAIVGQIVTILWVQYGLKIPLPILQMMAVLVFLLALNVISWFKAKGDNPIHDSALFMEMLFDIAALTVQLYLSGGASNPFMGLYLLQVITAATLLRGIMPWLLVAITISGAIFLHFYNIPLPHLWHYHLGDFFSLHMQGMFISYVLIAVLATAFMVQMTRNLEQRDRALADAREHLLVEENILRLGMLAAGAAHELSTPLGTMALLAEHYQQTAENLAEQNRARMLHEQAMRCKNILTQMVAKAGAARAESGKPEALDCFLAGLVTAWRLDHPDVVLTVDIASAPAPTIIAEYTFAQAIVTLLDNAAEASPEAAMLAASWDTETITLQITDKGGGIAPEIVANIGAIGISSKPDGLGMGLYLAQAVITRLGGRLQITAKNNGTEVTISLPRITVCP